MIQISIYFIISPLSGAAIGYVTNWVAIRMLFRPHNEKRLFGRRLPFTPGLMPKRRFILSRRIGRTISDSLLDEQTLIRHMLGDGVKEKLAAALAGLLNEIKEKTLGGLLLGQGYSRADLEAFLSRACTLLSGDGLADGVARLEKSVLEDERKINELLPADVADNIRLWLSQNAKRISELMLMAVKSPFFDSSARPAVISVIERNVSGFASFFVVGERVYENIYESLVGYLQNPDNYALTAEKLLSLFDRATETSAKRLACVFAGDGEAPLSALLYRLEHSNDEALSEIKGSLARLCAEKLADYAETARVSDVLSMIGQTRLKLIKNMLMSKYDAAVEGCFPSVLASLDLAEVIEARINAFEMQEAEDIVISVVDRELKAITRFGGLLGFIIGLLPPVLQALGLG